MMGRGSIGPRTTLLLCCRQTAPSERRGCVSRLQNPPVVPSRLGQDFARCGDRRRRMHDGFKVRSRHAARCSLLAALGIGCGLEVERVSVRGHRVKLNSIFVNHTLLIPADDCQSRRHCHQTSSVWSQPPSRHGKLAPPHHATLSVDQTTAGGAVGDARPGWPYAIWGGPVVTPH